MKKRSARRGTSRAGQASRANESVVTLTKGDDFVRFETTRGEPFSTFHNSVGEYGRIPVAQGRTRIATLVKAGWSIASKVSPQVSAYLKKSKAQLDDEVRQMLTGRR